MISTPKASVMSLAREPRVRHLGAREMKSLRSLLSQARALTRATAPRF